MSFCIAVKQKTQNAPLFGGAFLFELRLEVKAKCRYAVRAGYKAEAAITTLQKFEALKGGAGEPELFSTHPNDSSRIEALEKEIAELKNN